jgi:phosphoglycerate kinase
MHLSALTPSIQKVLVRLDLNVPQDNEEVLDTFRIFQAKKTITYLTQKGYAVFVVSHIAKGSLKKIVPLCSKIWETPVVFGEDCLTPPDIRPGEVAVLENLRIYKGETQNDREFAKSLASVAQAYVNDAFSVCHRKHASVDAICEFLPPYFGFQIIEEVKHLSQLMHDSKHPFIALIGGSKISTKLPLLKNLINKADLLFIGGAMSHTFLASRGYEINESSYEKELLKEAKELDESGRIILPVDVVLNTQEILSVESLTERDYIRDIGPDTLSVLSSILCDSKTVMWNGPMGLVEQEPFDKGTKGLIALLDAHPDLFWIVGGGETAMMINKQKATPSFLSTGGGAFLAFLEGKKLPGLKEFDFGAYS